MDDGERLIGADRRAHAAHVREADRGIDRVLGAPPAAPEVDDEQADGSRVDLGDRSRALGHDGEVHGRVSEVPVGGVDEIVRPPSTATIRAKRSAAAPEASARSTRRAASATSRARPPRTSSSQLSAAVTA